MNRSLLLVSLLSLLSAAGCAARAAPLEAEGVVLAAGTTAPVAAGSACTLSLWPEWRQGVNCQMLVRCDGQDLFGGKRIGGYAICGYEDGHFTSATDHSETDGDPAIHIDFAAQRIRWRDRDAAATLEIALSHVTETDSPEESSAHPK